MRRADIFAPIIVSILEGFQALRFHSNSNSMKQRLQLMPWAHKKNSDSSYVLIDNEPTQGNDDTVI